MILTLRTDKPEAEVSLRSKDSKVLSKKVWHAHRELSGTIHKKILEQLQKNNASWGDIAAVIFYAGPGSFTGLRIGATVANTLASSLSIAIVSSGGQFWVKEGLEKLSDGTDEKIVKPTYGGEANITKQKK